jgi:hypothetical protein
LKIVTEINKTSLLFSKLPRWPKTLGVEQLEQLFLSSCSSFAGKEQLEKENERSANHLVVLPVKLLHPKGVRSTNPFLNGVGKGTSKPLIPLLHQKV